MDDAAGLLQRHSDRRRIAAVRLEDREGRNDPSADEDQTVRGEALAGDQPRRARFPCNQHWAEVEKLAAARTGRRRIRGQGRAAEARVDGLYGRDDFPQWSAVGAV